MEEDIEVLKDFLELREIHSSDNCRTSYLKTYQKAIENLIARYKQLEKQLEEKEMQHELELIGKEEYTKEAMGEIIEHYYTANEDCILKSKVKEKIEDLNIKMAEQLKIITEFGEHEKNRAKLTMYKEQRDILGELLED